MPNPIEDLGWKSGRRLEYLEWRAFWEGRVNRKDLEEKFGISTPQASLDFRKYIDYAPQNLLYDAAQKAYIPTTEFKPIISEISTERYLLQLRAIMSNAVDKGSTWFDSVPHVAITQDLFRKITPDTLRDILKAIREKLQITVFYQSLTIARYRNIAPHSLAFDGHRWHVRAWSEENGDFRDFLLSRIASIDEGWPTEYDVDDDVEWSTPVTMVIKPHPGLTGNQREAISQDYDMRGGRVEIEVRAALAYYFIKRMNLDIDLPAQRKQIVLSNLDEVQETIRRTRDETRQRIRERSIKG